MTEHDRGGRIERTGRAAPIAALLCVALAVPGPITSHAADDTAVSASTLDETERRLDEAGARLRALDAEIAAQRTQRRELEASVAAARSRVEERGGRIDGLDRDIARFEARLLDLERSVAREQAGLDQRRERLAATLRGTHRLDGHSRLRSALEHDDPALAARLGVYADYLLRAQREALDAQTRALGIVERARAATLRDRAWLEHLRRKAAGQREALAAVQSRHASALDALDEDIASTTRSVAELTADRTRLQALAEELRSLRSTRSGYFVAGRGSYSLPTDGDVSARFGETKAVGKVRWNGLFVTAADGAPVRGIADGEVVYADHLRGFGQLVILDHGDGFMTLYGGNRDIRVQPGEWIEAGATIATVGDGSGQSDTGVYVEIRENARPIDPTPWFAPGEVGG